MQNHCSKVSTRAWDKSVFSLVILVSYYYRIRDANLAARGIDGNDIDQQVKQIEDRGKELLKDYMAQKDRTITREESESILEPMTGAFKLMENALNMTGKL
jgi:hypothetical protein